MAMATISGTVQGVRQTFGSFFEVLNSSEDETKKSMFPTETWREDLGRFRIWASNIGAHQRGQSSLDYRLRDASHIRNQILNLLKDLQATIVEAIDLFSAEDSQLGERAPTSDLPTGSILDERLELEVEQLHNELVNIINGLYRMSMLIRRPAPHDRITRTHAKDAAFYELYDQAHVKEKFPSADTAIIALLGAASTRRRKALIYRKRHHHKLSQGMEDGPEATADHPEDTLSETVATELVTPSSCDFEAASASSEASETSYAASILEGDGMTVPDPPTESSDQQLFQCPYCFFIISIKNRRDWAKHIFKDLVPYVCVFTNCESPHMMYESRHQWFTHEINSHLLRGMSLEPSWTGLLPKASDLPDLDCPLCCQRSMPGTRIERHIARHLEDVALFALPRDAWDTVDETSRDDQGASDVTSVLHVDIISKSTAGSTSSAGDSRSSVLLPDGDLSSSRERSGLGGNNLEQASDTPLEQTAPKERDDRDVEHEIAAMPAGEAVAKKGQGETAEMKNIEATVSQAEDELRLSKEAGAAELAAKTERAVGDDKSAEEATAKARKELVEALEKVREQAEAEARAVAEVAEAQVEAESAGTPLNLHTKPFPCKFFKQGICQAGNACPFLHSTDIGALDANMVAEEELTKSSKESQKEEVRPDRPLPIRFKDAVGRKFNFPFHLCAKWSVSYSLQ
jgi:hypothetical protein